MDTHAQGQCAHAQMYTGQHGHMDTPAHPRGQTDTDTHSGTLAGTRAQGRGASGAAVGQQTHGDTHPGARGSTGARGRCAPTHGSGGRDPRGARARGTEPPGSGTPGQQDSVVRAGAIPFPVPGQRVPPQHTPWATPSPPALCHGTAWSASLPTPARAPLSSSPRARTALYCSRPQAWAQRQLVSEASLAPRPAPTGTALLPPHRAHGPFTRLGCVGRCCTPSAGTAASGVEQPLQPPSPPGGCQLWG